MHMKAKDLAQRPMDWRWTRTFTPQAVTGDFDGNETVDGSDFLLWQRGLGKMGDAVASDGDADDDSDVDGNDLVRWGMHFGENSMSQTAAAAVSMPPTADRRGNGGGDQIPDQRCR